MQYSYLKATLYGAFYVLLVLSPLLLMLPGARPVGRGFWVDFGVAMGFVGLAMLSVQFLITGRFRNVAQGFGSDNLLQFHLATGVVGMFLVLAHPLIIILGESAYLVYFDPRVNFMRTFSLVGALLAMIAVVVTSLWRKKFRLIYEWWRVAHGGLGFIVVFVGLVHVLQVSYFTDVWWKQAIMMTFTGGAMALLIHTRVIKPQIMKRFPYQVTEVHEERADGTTLVIEPVDHRGMQFEAGQYVWMTLGDSPYSLQQHPFSIASSAEDPTRLMFTSKPAGDFTGTWSDIEAGTGAFLEGPYGAFTQRETDKGSVFFAGGVGVTPIMSMFRTLADRGDERSHMLFYANKTWEDVIFREELEEIQQRLKLEMIHVLEEAPEDWDGEEGFVDAGVLDRHLPTPYEEYFYYICGPEPMMDLVEQELVNRDISLRTIMSERFEIV